MNGTGGPEGPRSVWVVCGWLTVGIGEGAMAGSVFLTSLDGVRDPAVLAPALTSFMVRLALVVVVLTLIATWGIEPAQAEAPLSRAADREDAITLSVAWRLITSSRQVLVFFCFLMAFTLAVFLQDPILESYGG